MTGDGARRGCAAGIASPAGRALGGVGPARQTTSAGDAALQIAQIGVAATGERLSLDDVAAGVPDRIVTHGGGADEIDRFRSRVLGAVRLMRTRWRGQRWRYELSVRCCACPGKRRDL
jgi:hypothetical protein